VSSCHRVIVSSFDARFGKGRRCQMNHSKRGLVHCLPPSSASIRNMRQSQSLPYAFSLSKCNFRFVEGYFPEFGVSVGSLPPLSPLSLVPASLSTRFHQCSVSVSRLGIEDLTGFYSLRADRRLFGSYFEPAVRHQG